MLPHVTTVSRTAGGEILDLNTVERILVNDPTSPCQERPAAMRGRRWHGSGPGRSSDHRAIECRGRGLMLINPVGCPVPLRRERAE